MLIKMADSNNSNFTFMEAEDALNNEQVSARFSVLVDKIKTSNMALGTPVAPYKSEDFLYFKTVIMHAAERANLDDKGELTGDGRFETKQDGDKELWKWISDKGIHPYANANGDIFPEAELKKAAGTWVGKGLYCNHQSSDVEKLRGIIIDTQYDEKTKQLWGLVALDRKNFPVLASQVKNGTIRNVSMGTAVKKSYCTKCANIAYVEADYCDCVKKLKGRVVEGTYVGEINVGLNGVELSLVSIPADRGATIRHVYAALASQFEEMKKSMSNEELDNSEEAIQLQEEMKAFQNMTGSKDVIGGCSMNREDLAKRAASRRQTVKAYFQGTVEPKPGQTMYPPDPQNEKLRNEELAKAKREENETAPKMGDKGGDQKVRSEQQRTIAQRKADREKIVQSYYQGTEEPKQGGQYTPDPKEMATRKQEESKFQSEATATKVKPTGMASDDEAVKDKLQRATYLGARFVFAKDNDGEVIPEKSAWVVYATENPDDEWYDDDVVFHVTAANAYGSDLYKVAVDVDGNKDPEGRTNWQFISSKEYGRELIDFIKSEGIDTVMESYKTAADLPPVGAPAGLGPQSPGAGIPGEEVGGESAVPKTLDDVGEPEPGLDEPKEKEDKEKIPTPAEAVDKAREAVDMIEKALEEAGQVPGMDTAVKELGELPEEAVNPEVPQEEGAAAVEEAGGMSPKAYAILSNFVKNAEIYLEAKKKKKEEDKKKKDKDMDDEEDKPKKKKCDCDKKSCKVCNPPKEEKVEKGKKSKGLPPWLEKKKKGDEDIIVKEAGPTGKEIKDISAPSNKGTSISNPTGKDIKDIGDIESALITDSVDSESADINGSEDPANMHFESTSEQHKKDLDAATSNPTGKSASENLASKIANAVNMETVEAAKTEALARMKRSYDLALYMVGKGLIAEASVKAKADELYALPEPAFDSFKRTIEAMPNVSNVKIASANVASLGNINGDTTRPEVDDRKQENLTDKLRNLGWK